MPTSQNPADIPTTIPRTTLILSHFANLKLAGDRVVQNTVTSLTTNFPSTPTRAPIHNARRPRRRRRPNRSTRVHRMSDADLEAELAIRRAARARERDRYAKALRSEKLTVLEQELTRLRKELSRMDRASVSPVGAGTPPTARWEALPERRSRSVGVPSMPSMPGTPAPGVPPPPSAPPPPPPAAGEVVMDPEKRRRDKEERQRRREAKRKEREANNKPLTLAEIIKSAGPDPMKRLKPPGSIPVPDIHAPVEELGEDIKGAKEGLKKIGKEDEEEGMEKTEEKDESDIEKDGDGDGKKENASMDDKDDGKSKMAEDMESEVSDTKGGKEKENPDSSKDEADNIESETKGSGNQSPTKVTSTASSPEKSTATTPKSPEQESQPKTESVEPKKTEATESNGTPNGAANPLAVLSKLKAKLPSGDGVGSNSKSTGEERKERKRISVEEKRRLRRAAKEAGDVGNGLKGE